jgi:hypothetical protein
MLYRGFKSLNKLNAAEEAKRVIIAKALILINNFNFLKILLNLIMEAAF